MWIIFCSLLAFPVIYPYGNLAAVDALFFGCSGSTESGLNTVNVNELKTYQQVFLYVIPIITNIMFINGMVVVVRLYWFRLRLKEELGPKRSSHGVRHDDPERGAAAAPDPSPGSFDAAKFGADAAETKSVLLAPPGRAAPVFRGRRPPAITFDDPSSRRVRTPRLESDMALRVPSPRSSDNGEPMSTIQIAPGDGADVVHNDDDNDDDNDLQDPGFQPVRRTYTGGSVLQAARSIEKAATSLFVLGADRSRRTGGDRSLSRHRSLSRAPSQDPRSPQLSRQATFGRNSRFTNLTEEDREILGGVEYRALKMLLRFVWGYFAAIHLFGVICLLPWIHVAPAKYTDWLAASGVGKTWWAVYSAQTMANNLGFTLTPDSMATFRDATWPMLVMTFMAYAGNTCYPILLRLCIWIASRLVPRGSQTRETLQFLLDHPRRCYTLLFPSRPTWILFGTVVLLNVTDVLLIIVLDLNNPTVTDLPMGPRILSALFQAASARHTGTSTLNLSEINPAVQFSLLTMMYIAVFPLAISVRASNTYEERALGIWAPDATSLDESDGVSYVLDHMRNQLSFDLWYIFLGTFLVCVAESHRIMDLTEPSFSVFPVIFEVTSAYGNVGLSLGGPLGNTSMSGHYTVFGKVVICFMMIRGRHRGLPVELDRAITLPTRLDDDGNEHQRLSETRSRDRTTRATLPMTKANTFS